MEQGPRNGEHGTRSTALTKTTIDILIQAENAINNARRVKRILSTPTMLELCTTCPDKVFALVVAQDFDGLNKLRKEQLNFEEFPVKRLRELARYKFTNWYRMDRYQLIEALTHYEQGVIGSTTE